MDRKLIAFLFNTGNLEISHSTSTKTDSQIMAKGVLSGCLYKKEKKKGYLPDQKKRTPQANNNSNTHTLTPETKTIKKENPV